MNEVYDVAAIMNEYLNPISIIIFFLVIGGIGIHILLRIRRNSRSHIKEE